MKEKKPPETMDYDMFKFIEGNRPIDHTHVNRLIRAFKDHAEQKPVVINEKGEILDGQHSFLARKALHLPIPYIVFHGGDLDTVHRLNTNQKKWTFLDYAHSWINRAEPKQDYKVYLDFIDKYEFSHRVSVYLLLGTNTKADDAFRQGMFMVKSYDQAVVIAEKINKVGDYYKGYYRRSCVTALLALFKIEKFDYDMFISKLSYKSAEKKIKNQLNHEDYLVMFIRIYNTKTHEDNKLKVALQ